MKNKKITFYLKKFKEEESSRKKTEDGLKSVQQNLKILLDEYRVIFDNSMVGILFVKNRVISKVNFRLCAMFGYLPHEVLGLNTVQFHLSKYYYDLFNKKYLTKLSNKEVVHLEYEFRKKDGSLIWCQLSGKAIDTSDLSKGIVWIIDDITHKKKAEEDLIDAKHKAESEAAVKAQFLANMSHEIRTPVQSIIGMSLLSLDSFLPDQQRIYIEKIHDSSKFLLSLINDILDYSKIESAGVYLDLVEFSIEDILKELIDLIELQIYEKEIEFFNEISLKTPLKLIGDPLRLKQVLLNIAGNAVKFIEAGWISISVKGKILKNSEVDFSISIKDTGPGIDEETAKQLFHPFAQADSSTVRKFGGTGLGLSISNYIIKKMNGDILLESEAGKGSNFIINIPLKASLNFMTFEEKFKKCELESINVLVADSSDASKRNISQILSAFRIRFVFAENINQILYELHNTPKYDKFSILILNDNFFNDFHKMSEKLSYELANVNVKVILIASLFNKNFFLKNHKNFISFFVKKPFLPGELLKALFDTLKGENNFKNYKPREKMISKKTPVNSDIKILIVEDNKTNQIVICEFLKKAGIGSFIAENGLRAVELVTSNEFDLVLMDINMPVMDGFESTRKIRELYSADQLPIIAMTANVIVEDRESFFKAGMNDYMIKPVNPELLFEKVDRWISAKEVPDKSCHVNKSEPIEKFEFIDVKKAIERFGDNRALYFKVLKNFFNEHRFDHKKIFKLLKTQDFLAAKNLVHSLKGACSTLGIWKLGDVCNDFEDSLKKEDLKLISEKSLVFLKVFRDVYKVLKTNISDNHDENLNFVEEFDVKDELIKLKEALIKKSTESEIIVEKLGIIFEHHKNEQLRNAFFNMKHEIENYEFKKAIQLFEIFYNLFVAR